MLRDFTTWTIRTLGDLGLFSLGLFTLVKKSVNELPKSFHPEMENNLSSDITNFLPSFRVRHEIIQLKVNLTYSAVV